MGLAYYPPECGANFAAANAREVLSMPSGGRYANLRSVVATYRSRLCRRGGYLSAMKIYTTAGDRGDTGLFGGGRVAKDHPRVEAYGEVDELNAALGLARSIELMPRIDEVLAPIQRDLFAIGALLATPDREKMRQHREKAR